MDELPRMNDMTPVLTVESIEQILPFWIERLGFEVLLQVPEEGRLDFVMVGRNEVKLMYQSLASVLVDSGLPEETFRGQSFLYFKVDDLDRIEAALEGYPVAVPRRKTFYGADEIGYRDPAGHVMLFSEHEDAPGD